MKEKDLLKYKIERLREELHQLAQEKKRIDDPKVVEKSKELDRIIAEYTAKYSSKEPE